MSKYPVLSRLPKPLTYTRVTFYRQNPGSPSDLFGHKLGQDILDPSHPAAKTPYKHFPRVQNECFLLRAFPNAVTAHRFESTGSPDWPCIDTWKSRVERAAELRKSADTNASHLGSQLNEHVFENYVAPAITLPHPERTTPMTLYFTTPKQKTHKHAVIRGRLRKKFREAVNLIVSRGANVGEVKPGMKGLVLNEEEVQKRGHKWILPDWAYICYLDAKTLLMPYHELIPHIRTSLGKVWDLGMHLERTWAEIERGKQLGLPFGDQARKDSSAHSTRHNRKPSSTTGGSLRRPQKRESTPAKK